MFGAWGGKDGAGDASGEEAIANKTCEARFVAGAAAADDGDVGRGGEGRGIAVDYFIGLVEEEGGIC